MNLKDKIYTIRGKQVMLDWDLAELYEVEVKYLKRQVRRNNNRFPERFCFKLSKNEENSIYLSCKNVTIENNRGKHSKYLPYAFTEQGILMLSSVLRSKKAVEISIKIIDAFVTMKKFLSKNATIFQRLDKVETKLIEHDKNFEKVFDAMQDKLPEKASSMMVRFIMHTSLSVI